MNISRSLMILLGAGVLTALSAACGTAPGESGFDSKHPKGPGSGTGAAGDDGGGPGSDPFGSLMDGGAPAGPCVNLQCRQVACAGGAKTTVSGTVYDPAGKNPLYNVVVYVPNGTPKPIVDGASCDKCDTLYTGSPLVSALSGPDGKFTLENVPVGDEIPLVIQIGKWRRQIKIPTVTQCVNTPLTNTALTRLPANSREGDMPKIAITTGGADSLECLLPRIGIDPTEITSGGATRIQIYQGTGGNAVQGGSPKPDKNLWNATASLMQYDIVALSCEGQEYPGTKPMNDRQALQDYTAAGGRVFASHFHYYWFSQGPTPFPQTASWLPQPGPGGDLGNISGTIDQSFPKGIAFNQWLKNVNALQSDGTLPIVNAKLNATVNTAVNKGSQPWITNSAGPGNTEYFTFNTPVGVADDKQCGRVVYSDLHVGAASNDYKSSKSVPGGCGTGDLTPQEKALEFMLFDLSSCLLPDSVPPTAPPPPPAVR